ncbi:MAG: ATP-binding protein [Clostridia bacterium]|nr:ATP-binding protein [Clostridia bacterium]
MDNLNDLTIEKMFGIPKLLPLREDEYAVDGLPYCKKCKTARFVDITTSDNERHLIRTNCDCLEAELKKKQQQEAIERRIADFKKRQKLTMMGEKYLNARFNDAIITENNEKAYESARNYVLNAKQIKENNIGLYIYGDNSSGKTYLIACICNALVELGYSCTFTSIPKLLAEINRKTRENGMSQAEIVDTLSKKSFVFIDDLGKEFLGNRQDYEWVKAEKLLLEVLNARYGNGLPTIFTSNYSFEDFATKFGLDKAILERVNEMSTKVIKLEGDNFRDEALQEKAKIADKLGI